MGASLRPAHALRSAVSLPRAVQDRLYDGEIAYADRELGRLMEHLWHKSHRKRRSWPYSRTTARAWVNMANSPMAYSSTIRRCVLRSALRPGVPAGLRVPQQPGPSIYCHDPGTDGVPASPAWRREPRPVLQRQEAPTAVSYAETLYPKINLGWAELRAIRTNQWKYIRAPRPELYDLSRDPGEANNVLSEHPSEVRKLEAKLAAVTGPAVRRRSRRSPWMSTRWRN